MKKLVLTIATLVFGMTTFAASAKSIPIVANNEWVNMLVKTQICTYSKNPKNSPPIFCVEGPTLKFDESSPNYQEVTIPDDNETFLHVSSVLADFLKSGKKIVTTTTYPEPERCAAWSSSNVIILNDLKTNNIIVCQQGQGKVELTK